LGAVRLHLLDRPGEIIRRLAAWHIHDNPLAVDFLAKPHHRKVQHGFLDRRREIGFARRAEFKMTFSAKRIELMPHARAAPSMIRFSLELNSNVRM
jgi:hypothetical protein